MTTPTFKVVAPELSVEPNTEPPGSSTHREAFIPLRKAELLDCLCENRGLSPYAQDSLKQFARLLDVTLHYEFHAKLTELKDLYAPFDPDADAPSREQLSAADRQLRLNRLFERFAELLQNANFRRLGRHELEHALQSASEHGLSLEIDFDAFERLDIYCRGEVTRTRLSRRWGRLFGTKEIQVPMYQRLVIIFRLRAGRRQHRQLDTNTVFIKLFKDIPKADLEMLLPATRVKMLLIDRIKIILPTVSGLAVSIFKAIKGALLVAAAGVYGILAVLGVTLGYGLRSFYGYQQTKQKYQLNLTESLYYQNLDNHTGVICRLLDEAEEQEHREALLGYYFLWQCGDSQGLSAEQLDARIEHDLAESLGCQVDFEVTDALTKLVRWGIVRCNAQGRYVAAPIDQALAILDQIWDNCFTYRAA